MTPRIRNFASALAMAAIELGRALCLLAALATLTPTPAGAAFEGFGVDTNNLGNGGAPVIANYTIATTDCGKTIEAGTGSTGQFTLTLPAVTGFPANCSVLIKNGDMTTNKTLSGFPSDLNTVLSPLQSVGIKIVNGVWASFYNPGAWAAPAGSLNLYASASGSDTNNSCTNSGSPCTLKGACAMRSQIAVYLATSVAINLADGTYSSVDASNALCTQNGNGGNGPILTNLTGDCTTPANVILQVPANATGVLVQDLAEVNVTCLTIIGGNGSVGLSGGQFAIIDVQTVHFGTFGTNSVHVAMASQSSYNILSGGEIIDGNAAFHWQMRSNAILSGAGGTSISTPVAFSGAFLDTRGAVYLNLVSWTLSGSGVAGTTGTRATLEGPGFILSATACNSLFPGNSNCVITLGFQDLANDALTTPFPAANIPNPTASTLGGIESIVATAHQWIASIDTSGVPHQSQPAFSDISGSVAASQLPNPSASTLGGIESYASVAHQWINAISTSGVPSSTQPATSDLSDVTAPTAWTATDGSGANLTSSMTISDTRYAKTGKSCTVSFFIGWPATSDTHTAQINGIPSGCAAYSGTLNWVAGGSVFVSSSGIGSSIGWVTLQAGGQSLFIFGNGGQLTNANMSNGSIRGTITYITN